MFAKIWNPLSLSILLIWHNAKFTMAIPTTDIEGTKCSALTGKDTGCLYAGEQSEWMCISGVKKQCAKGLVCVHSQDPVNSLLVTDICGFPPHPDIEHPEVGKKYPAGTRVRVGTTKVKDADSIPQYCQIPLPTGELAAGSTSCIRGSQMASTYTSSNDGACKGHYTFAVNHTYVAAYHYNSALHLSSGFNTELCGKPLEVTNKKTGKKITVTVVDNCPSCTGIAPAYEDEFASTNGATIDLDTYAFAALFDGATSGVFDVEYTAFEGDLTRELAISPEMD